MSRDYVDPYVLLATIGLGLLVACIGYVGWWYGHEQGTCEVGCGGDTAGMGKGVYRGGTCRCMINGEEVTPL